MELFLVAAWSLWNERNNNYFRHIPPSIYSWKRRFKTDFSNLKHRASEKHIDIIAAFVESVT